MAIIIGVPQADAVGWVRANYHRWAVESPELQVPLIGRFARWATERGATSLQGPL
jgi:hypothetical protein